MCSFAQVPVGQRAGVAVEDDDVGGVVALVRLHMGDAARLAGDAAGLRGIVEADAKGFGGSGKGGGERLDAVGDRPDPLRLGLPDKGQDGGSMGGAAADISGVAAEQLAEPGVAEELC